MFFAKGQGSSSCGLDKGHVPAKSRKTKSSFSEYEARTVVRIRVRRIVIRIRIRHTAIRVRTVIGARQNKGKEESACIFASTFQFHSQK